MKKTHIPNKETREAIMEAKNNPEKLTAYNSVEEMFEDILSEDNSD